MKALLSEIEEAVGEEAALGGSRLASERAREFETRYQQLLEAGLAAKELTGCFPLQAFFLARVFGRILAEVFKR
jgi:hypothetical protein